MPKSDEMDVPTGDHQSVSASVPKEHETWAANASVEGEQPEFKDDAAGESRGMLESILRSEQNSNVDDLSGSISGPLLAAAPWAWIFRLTARYEDGSEAVYTGWLASPRIVVTSGRCLYDPSRGAAQEILVETGQNRGTFGPRAVKSKDFRMVKGWVSSANPECDYGAVLLPSSTSLSIGHFGLAWLPISRPKEEWLNLAGYSVDGSNAPQWYEGFQVADADDRFLRRVGGFHAAAAGSPLWLCMTRNGRMQRYVCGLVSSNADRGEALRLHRDIYSNLTDWITTALDAGPALGDARGERRSFGGATDDNAK